jgi:hypothetical protein
MSLSYFPVPSFYKRQGPFIKMILKPTGEIRIIRVLQMFDVKETFNEMNRMLRQLDLQLQHVSCIILYFAAPTDCEALYGFMKTNKIECLVAYEDNVQKFQRFVSSVEDILEYKSYLLKM